MNLTCYSYIESGRQLLGGIKEVDNGFSLLLQDNAAPFSDLLGADKRIVFSSFQQALEYLEFTICLMTGKDKVLPRKTMSGVF